MADTVYYGQTGLVLQVFAFILKRDKIKYPDKYMIQSILFDKELWTATKARRWLKRHGHKLLKGADITQNYIRFRLHNPREGHIYRTHNLGKANGIKLILEYEDSQEGRGLFENIKNRIKLFLQGPKKTAHNKFQSIIDANSDSPITHIWVCKEPVMSGIKKIMSWLSLGKLDEKAKELGYDDVYHAYIVVQLANGKKFRLEKNQVVECRPASDKDLKNPAPIPVTERDLTIAKLIERGSNGNKDVAFWVYNPEVDNCQLFVKKVVDRNGLAKTAEVQKVIQPQDGKQLIKTLGIADKIPGLVTDLAARGERLIQGDGVKPKMARKARKKADAGCGCTGGKIFVTL